MVTFYIGLTVFEKILFILASAGTLLLVVQIILVLLGLGHGGDGVDFHDVGGDLHTDFNDVQIDGDTHADMHTGAELSLFTVKGFIGFFSVGGWAGLAVSQAGGHIVLVILVALASGIAAMYGVAYLYRLGLKMQEDGTLNINNAIGQIAKVYLTIPSKGNGSGKITMNIQDRYTELDAVTESSEPIKTDEMVRVLGAYENTLIVEKLEK